MNNPFDDILTNGQLRVLTIKALGKLMAGHAEQEATYPTGKVVDAVRELIGHEKTDIDATIVTVHNIGRVLKKLRFKSVRVGGTGMAQWIIVSVHLERLLAGAIA